jgi:formylglycine-generating enzyme required for sulfatase activity
MTTEAQDYFNQLQAAEIAQGQAKLRTLALEFQATLSRLPAFQAEIDTILSQGAGIDYDGLAVRMEPALTQAGELLIELDLLPAEIRDAAAMREFSHMMLATLTARTVEPLTKKFHDQHQQVEQTLKEEAKKKAEAEARAMAEQKAREKAEAEARKRAQIEKETAERLKVEAERQARALVEAEARKRAQLEKEETERKIKAEAERRAQEKVEAEARKREQQEKEEAERKVKAEAERRAQEAAEKKRQEAVKAELEAANKAKAEAQKKARAEAAKRSAQKRQEWFKKNKKRIILIILIALLCGIWIFVETEKRNRLFVAQQKIEASKRAQREKEEAEKLKAEAEVEASKRAQREKEKAEKLKAEAEVEASKKAQREKEEAEIFAQKESKRKKEAAEVLRSLDMVAIPAGRFRMGCQGNDHACEENEKPPLAMPMPAFEIGKYEITFDLWDACYTQHGCTRYPDDMGWGRGKRPVINISWNDIQQFITWINTKTGKTFRLPSEPEWEYAARAGTTTVYSWGDEVGNNKANCDGCGSQWDNKQTAPVGSFVANPWGLHDMHGNVWEWVSGSLWIYKGSSSNVNDWVTANLSDRVVRGGSWYNNPRNLRAAVRFSSSPDSADYGLGFRLVLPSSASGK